MITTFWRLAAGVFLLGLVACNTVEGAGKDIQSGGDAISDTARDVKQRL
jgi:predicted small secreted protein